MTTKTATHTPGPWHIGGIPGCGRDPIVYGADGKPICNARTAYGSEPDGANARLIAAAPELLACAQMLYLVTAEGEFQNENERINLHRQAKAAIASATGGA